MTMTRCNQADADIIIDGINYRLGTIRQYKECIKFAGLKGVTFVNRENTELRLEAQHRAMLKQRRDEGRAVVQLG
jgi:hypothetical protein